MTAHANNPAASACANNTVTGACANDPVTGARANDPVTGARAETAHLRIVRGEPTPEELAALATVVGAGSPAPAEEVEPPRRGRWNDPAWAHRRPLPAGPGAWRASLR